jgi:signal transduction histidine kinase
MANARSKLLEESDNEECSEMLVSSLHVYFQKLAEEFNRSATDEPLLVTARRLDGEIAATVSADGHDTAQGPRLLVTSALWSMSLRVQDDVAEFFMLPATELSSLPNSELPSRLKLSLELAGNWPRVWALNGTQVSSDELNALMHGLFKDLVTRTRHDFQNAPESAGLSGDAQSFVGSIRDLVADKHSLLQKIVDQQENIQAQLARDLHDSVLGNVMLLRCCLSGNRPMSDSEMIKVLDEIACRLREICQELSPRDLRDCGLRPMLEELCLTLSRGGCSYTFNCPEPLPEFSDEVALHVYRIAQECFNNIVKHAGASHAIIEVSIGQGLFRMKISDNGVGFPANRHPRRALYGGTGSGIIKERTELINCLYPARVWIDSHPGEGTTVTLEIALP